MWSTEQIRLASSTEEAAAELMDTREMREVLQQGERGQRAGAVDVEREGLPPDEAWQPVEPLGVPHAGVPGPGPALEPAVESSESDERLPPIPEDDMPVERQ